MSNDRYTSGTLSGDSPNIYPVRRVVRDYPLRFPTEENTVPPPIERSEYSDDESIYLKDENEEPVPVSPIRRESLSSPNRRSLETFSPSTRATSPPRIIPTSYPSLEETSFGKATSPSSRVTPPSSRVTPPSSRVTPPSSRVTPPSSRVTSPPRIIPTSSSPPVGASFGKATSPSSRVTSPPKIIPTSSSPTRSSPSKSSTAKTASRLNVTTPVSHASRTTSPRSILFPIDADVEKEVQKTSSVEDLLISNGYIPVKTIIVDNAAGKSDFILSVNKRGQYVLVSLDGKGMNMGGNIIHTEIVKDSNTIPYSSKKGSFECANGVCGVAYDGENELNIVTRDEFSMEPRSDTLVYKGENIASIGNNVPIPVISYNDIVYNPIDVLKNSYEITDRLHRHEYENCKTGMVEASTEFKELESALKSYMLLEVALAKELANSMSILRGFAGRFERDPPIDEKERENYNLVKFNLRKRSDLFIILINCCSKISGMKNIFVELTKNIHELHELCEREFTGVNRVMSP